MFLRNPKTHAKAREYGLRIAHGFILLALRMEAWLSLPGGRRKIRIMSTACWTFPIYSQTFVYREVTELAKQNFCVRFSYSELASRSQLPAEFSALWRLRRKLVLSDVTSRRDFEHYQRSIPERVNAVARLISEASGLTEQEVLGHEHFRHALSFTRMVECWQADYIHTYFFYERTLFAFVASYLLGIPRGVSCYADHMLNDYRLKLVPMHMESCDVVVATSKRIKQELETLARKALPNVVVKPNAIDASHFPVEPSRPGKNAVCKVVTVSRIHAKKGLTHLVECALLLRERGVPVIFEVLGEPDVFDAESVAYYEELKRLIAASNLQSHLRLEGRKASPEVRSYLMAAEIFVAPFVELANGDKDGIPTALLEAMAAGCAIVSTDAGSILEAVDHDVEALVVPQRDGAALADAVEALSRNAELRARLSRAAMIRVRREFDIKHCEDWFHRRVQAVIADVGSQAVRERTA